MIVIIGILLTIAVQAAIIYVAYRDISKVFSHFQPYMPAQPKPMWACKTMEYEDRVEDGVRISKPLAIIIKTEGVTMRRALKPEDLRPLKLSDLFDEFEAAMVPAPALVESKDGKLRISDILNGYKPAEANPKAIVAYSGPRISMSMSQHERLAA